MALKFPDIAALREKALSKFKSLRSKGMKADAALEQVNEWLSDNEFSDNDGNVLKLSLEMSDADQPSGGSSDGASIQEVIKQTTAAVVKELMPAILETKGVRLNPSNAANVDVKPDFEIMHDDPKWGFKNVTDFALCYLRNNPAFAGSSSCPARDRSRWETHGKMIQAVRNGHIKSTPTTYASELVGADGGVLVPPEFRREIWIAVRDEYSILNKVDLTPTASNNVNWVADENAPWDNTSGIQVYWRQQATTMTQSKPVLQNRTIQLNELYAFVPATDELIQDAPMLNNYLGQKAPEKMGYAINDAVFRGTGQGQPLGFIGASATQTITANSTSNGYSTTDFSNMFSHLINIGTGNMRTTTGEWLMTPREYAILPTLGQSSSSGFPVAVANLSIAASLIPTVLGLPVYPTQHLPGANQKGSIALVDWSGYAAYNKEEGFDFQSSIHLFFDSGATALRWRFRFGGEPKLRQTVASANDTGNALSHFILLGGRPS